MHTFVLTKKEKSARNKMPVADNKSHSIDSNGSRSAQNGGSSGQQKHGSSRRGGSNKKSGSKSMVRQTYFIPICIIFHISTL